MSTFVSLGWSEIFAHHFEPYRQEGFSAGRITLEQKNLYMVATEPHGEIPAVVTGKLLHEALSREDLPVVGDWVVVRIADTEEPQATIHAVLPRASKLSRQAPGKACEEQTIAANIDIAFLLMGLDGNYNLRRMERHLLQTRKNNVRPVVLLTKADVRSDVDACVCEVTAVAAGAPVHAISTLTGAGLSALSSYLQPGTTIALLGSSGVGKSTLLNHLFGNEAMRTQTVRSDDSSRGRHTTSHRQLFLLPSGAALIDTPGMRELQLWGDEEGLLDTFPEIEALSRGCRFGDCQHRDEPDCAVRAALQTGELTPGRLENYQKMQRELQRLAAKTDRLEEQALKRKSKEIPKAAKSLKKRPGK
ncbi:MAG: ribosome small subunit-dependent GTPase A [Armatimonadia bacterium]